MDKRHTVVTTTYTYDTEGRPEKVVVETVSEYTEEPSHD
jgi:hypothetical protein